MTTTSQDRFVTIAVIDTNGLLRGQKLAAEDLEDILAHGIGMSPVQLALDPTDRILDMPGVTDEQGDFHDCELRIDPGSRVTMPFEAPADSGLYLAEFMGDAAGFCPRGLLRRVLERTLAAGFVPKVGFELEFTLFDETPSSLAAKDYENLRTATAHPSHDLIIYQAVQCEFYNQVADICEPLKVRLCKMHEEIGGGFMEACLRAGPALAVADQAVLLKNFVRVLAMRRGQIASFMPRWSEDADSQSSHMHISLATLDGAPCFWDSSAKDRMSGVFRHFLGGLQRYLPEIMLIFAPTVNSWRRFTTGTLAPPAFTWGIENRTTCLRVVGTRAGALRVENRLPCSDANPHLVAAATIAAGLAGINQRLEPSSPTVGNGFAAQARQGRALLRSMEEGIDALRASEFAQEWLGARFVQTFSATRAAQMAQFRGKSLIDERRRFFELG